MIKLCKNLFYKPKYGSDADSIMLKHLFSTVTTILVCLAAISFSAYAFFSYSVTSGANTIKSSSFSASVTIKKDGNLVTHGNIQSHKFDVPGEYAVTITADSGTTGTGFCIVTVGGTDYYTQQLGKDITAPNQERPAVSFVLDVKAASTVTFETRWGTTSHYDSVTESEVYIKNDPQKVIVVDATQSIADNIEETTPKETTPEETTPEETTPEETTPEETTPEETTPEETTPEETTPEETTPEETTPEETTPEETIDTTDSTKTVHTVLPGESLASIAEKYDTTYPILAAYNKIANPRIIQPGQEIQIPTADQVEAAPEVTQ